MRCVILSHFGALENFTLYWCPFTLNCYLFSLLKANHFNILGTSMHMYLDNYNTSNFHVCQNDPPETD